MHTGCVYLEIQIKKMHHLLPWDTAFIAEIQQPYARRDVGAIWLYKQLVSILQNTIFSCV